MYIRHIYIYTNKPPLLGTTHMIPWTTSNLSRGGIAGEITGLPSKTWVILQLAGSGRRSIALGIRPGHVSPNIQPDPKLVFDKKKRLKSYQKDLKKIMLNSYFRYKYGNTMQMNIFQSFQQTYTEIVCGTAWILVDLQERHPRKDIWATYNTSHTQNCFWENSKISLYSTIFQRLFFVFFALISNKKFPVFTASFLPWKASLKLRCSTLEIPKENRGCSYIIKNKCIMFSRYLLFGKSPSNLSAFRLRSSKYWKRYTPTKW